ncbi:MAG TPA: luciferase family protein [Solirubrobacteraceae bacterium]|nr:luciferase family protein [Solirubrobacteraceae bacterium]
MATKTPSEQITEAVAAWPRVETAHGRRGEIAFRVGRRELGHLHGDHTAHLAFPEDVWLELKEQNRILEHPVFSGKPGPAERRIEDDADVRDIIELMRINYDRIIADPAAAPEPDTEGPGRPRDLDYGSAGETSLDPKAADFTPRE